MIDGLNVARATSYSGGSLPGACSAHGQAPATPVGHAQALATAIDHFLAQGFEVHAILPTWALDGGRRTLIGAQALFQYIQGEVLHLSPTGTDDDDFILQLARARDGYVCTNDLFRDHILQGRVPKEWVAARRISYMYVQKQILTVMPSLPSKASGVPAAHAGGRDKRPRSAVCKRRLPRHDNRPGGIRPANILLQPVVPSSNHQP